MTDSRDHREMNSHRCILLIATVHGLSKCRYVMSSSEDRVYTNISMNVNMNMNVHMNINMNIYPLTLL